MSDVLPEVLRKSRRGICPTCGAPLKLADSARNVRCDFCGGECSLEHRLRRLEPEVAGLEAPKDAPKKGATRWLKLQNRRDQCDCPGCGNKFDPVADQDIQRCPYCGSESKLEARLRPITAQDVQGPQRRTNADFLNQRRGKIEYPWDVQTEQLFWRVLNEPDLMRRLALAQKFESWSYVNLTAAHFLPHLLRHIQADHDAVARCAGDVVGKLLCSDDANYAVPVLLACAGVVFDPRGKRCVLSELALGKGVCVKLLLDAAEAANALGAHDYACHALWGINTIFERNFDQHEIMAEVVLYRMFYLTGMVVGWATYMFRSGFHCGYHLPWRKMLIALDDFSHERPQLVAELRKCFYMGPAENADEYRARLDALGALTHPMARAAGGTILGAPPGDDGKLGRDAVDLFHPLLNRPECKDWALQAIRRVISGCEAVPQSIRDYVRENLATLPMEIKRELRWKKADEGVLPKDEVFYWTSEPSDEPSPEIKKQQQDWDAGIRAAVDAFRTRDADLREIRGKAKELDVPVFLEEGPATIPLKEPEPKEPPPPFAQPARRPPDTPDPTGIPVKGTLTAEQITAEAQRMQEDYAAKVTQMSAELQKPGAKDSDYARVSQQMMELSVKLQEEMQKLFERQA